MAFSFLQCKLVDPQNPGTGISEPRINSLGISEPLIKVLGIFEPGKIVLGRKNVLLKSSGISETSNDSSGQK